MTEGKVTEDRKKCGLPGRATARTVHGAALCGVFLALLLVLLVRGTALCAHASDGARNMYRLYNPNSGEHFYTAAEEERDGLVRLGWRYEGIGWVAPRYSESPVYRLYNPNAGDHHYTMNADERDGLMRLGWRYEGIGWYSDDERRAPLYRQYNPNAVAGSHNYTASLAENNMLAARGWRPEGVGWYALRTASSVTRTSGYRTIKVAGRTYRFRSEVYFGESYARAGAEAAYADGTAPAGYMGVEARLYSSRSGSLLAASGPVFNRSPRESVTARTEGVVPDGYVYSWGKAYLYNGTRYLEYEASPVGNAVTESDWATEAAECGRNAAGETYGPAQAAGKLGGHVDLIAAVGRNGQPGYVRAEELSPAMTYEEVSEYLERQDGPRVIPLYDAEGRVIGEFVVDGSPGEPR